ncbi:hypothetical protein T06_4545, partial [Trichinella sp. T6]
LRYVLRSPFHAYSHHLFAAPPSQSYPVHQASVVKTDKTPGGAFLLFCSCGCANLPDGCWSSQTHHERSKAEFLRPEATLAGNIGTRLPVDPTSQHL